MSNATSQFMSIAECAIYLRPNKPLNVKTVYRWAKKGQIPARKVNGMVLIHRGDLDRHLESKVVAPNRPSMTPFEQARMRVRSLKTECTVAPRIQKGRRDGN